MIRLCEWRYLDTASFFPLNQGGILWLRLGFTALLIVSLSRLYRRMPQPWIDRYLMVSVNAKTAAV